ncbi:bifunctional phosphoserine phosphatase/homoserine phosphotransferase ThrH [bacterium]|nr:bifunctional phosphoserine phosphatase/homoserine phosphotransferase ThrH [bacterium]
MNEHPTIIALDLEGVLVPEVWIAVAEKTGISELRLTTRDIADYDELMRRRLNILSQHKLTLADIQNVIAGLEPLDGAEAFTAWIRNRYQLVILSDTFYEFAAPLMKKLGYPTLFCHSLKVNGGGFITDYTLRLKDGKRQAVEALKRIAFNVIAAGDSYNDTTMLAAADKGILFRPPANVIDEFPQFPVTTTYDELKQEIEKQ